jgi:hypothetical protein
MILTLTLCQWDDFLVRVRLLAQDHKLLPSSAPAAAAPQCNAVAGMTRSATSTVCLLSLLRSHHAQPHEMQVKNDAYRVMHDDRHFFQHSNQCSNLDNLVPP